jgi:hypothetical protein
VSGSTAARSGRSTPAIGSDWIAKALAVERGGPLTDDILERQRQIVQQLARMPPAF